MDISIDSVNFQKENKKIEPTVDFAKKSDQAIKDALLKAEAKEGKQTALFDQAPKLESPSGKSFIELFKKLEFLLQLEKITLPPTIKLKEIESLLKALSFFGILVTSGKGTPKDIETIKGHFFHHFVDVSKKLQQVFPQSLRQFVRSFAFQLEAIPEQENNPVFISELIRQLDAFEKEAVSLFIFWKKLVAAKTTTLLKEEIAFLQANPFISRQFQGAKNMTLQQLTPFFEQFFQGVEVIFSLKGVLELFKNFKETSNAPQLLLASHFSHPYPKTTLIMGPNTELLLEKSATLIPNHKPKDVARVMEQALIFGTFFGRMVSKMDASPKVQAQIVQELKIVDQFPFSLFAHYVPFKESGEGSKPLIEEAKKSLKKLFRLLLQLIFLLGVVVASGQKGIDQRLYAYQFMLLSLLENLSFSLKKVSEIYGVQIVHSLYELEKTVDALRENQAERFFSHFFNIFNVNLPLADFLKEFEDSDPFFKAIEELIEQEEVVIPPSKM